MDISKTESQVMQVIWDKHPSTASEIIQRLNEQSYSDKVWHEKTVKTLINRLVKKGALGFEKQQRRYLYYPLIEKQAYLKDESRSLLNRLFGGRISPLVASFASQKRLEKEDVEELKALIEQWEKEND